MRKILSLVLGLLWALPAHADNPCRNLANLNDTTYAAQYWTVDTSTGTISTEQADANFSFWIRNAKAGEQYIMSADLTAVSGGGMQFQVRDSSNQVLSAMGGAGTVGRAVSTAYTIPSDGDYRFNLRTNGSAAFTATDIQIENGSTATAYTPYDPQCATCDGTVVNYVSATGTGVQNGTPTPENPIEPVFYQQGNMVLRKVGDYADSYDATTGKITRRVGVKVFDGTEDWTYNNYAFLINLSNRLSQKHFMFCTHFNYNSGSSSEIPNLSIGGGGTANAMFIKYQTYNTVEQFKQWLADQYAAGTPVTVWYPLAEETTEDWPASYCQQSIKIATTKYNESAFGPLNTALANAISVVDSVVSNTITQAASIATLQAQKQTRPNDIADDNEKCPAGKKCLLVEDASGVPHWYEIVTGRLPDGYTELEYIESTGTQWIDTNVLVTDDISWEGRFLLKNDTSKAASIFGYRWTETPTAQGNMRFVFVYPDGAFAVRFGVNASRSNLIISGSEVITLKYENDKFYANGNLFYTETDKNYDGEAQSGYLFNANALYNVDVIPSKMKLYYFKMWDNGTLVRDFVPALNPDGKIGMYDLVGGRFYENKGTGTFIGGQPVFN